MIDFKNNVGKTLTIKGKITGIMWQHMFQDIEGYPNTNYVDLEENAQIVVYSKEPITCKGQIEVTGEIIKVGHEKGDPREKIPDEYWEYHMIVESWKCIEE